MYHKVASLRRCGSAESDAPPAKGRSTYWMRSGARSSRSYTATVTRWRRCARPRTATFSAAPPSTMGRLPSGRWSRKCCLKKKSLDRHMIPFTCAHVYRKNGDWRRKAVSASDLIPSVSTVVLCGDFCTPGLASSCEFIQFSGTFYLPKWS